MLLLVPLLKQVMSSKQIFIAYALGGFVAVNLHCATQYFFNPNSGLPIDELQRRLDSVPLLEHSRSHRSKLWDDARTKLTNLSQEVVDLKDEQMREKNNGQHSADSSSKDKEPETKVNEDDLMRKGPKEDDPTMKEFDTDKPSRGELTKDGADGEKAEKTSDEERVEKDQIKDQENESTSVGENAKKEDSSAEQKPATEPTKTEPKDLQKEIEGKLVKIEETKKEIADLQNTQLLFDYAGVSLGTSCSMTCLSKN